MKPGDTARITRVFHAADLAGFQTLAGVRGAELDYVPEPLIGGLFSRLLGAELPGYGTNYLKQEMTFHGRAPVGEPLTASVEVTRLRPEKQLVDLVTRCVDTRGDLVCEGRALVLVKDVEG